MNEIAPGVAEMNELQSAGFQPNEIDQWQAETRTQLQEAGFSTTEVEEYFGNKEPDMAPTKAVFQTNLQTAAAAKAEKAPAPNPDAPMVNPEVEQADNFLEAIEAGFDMSVTGLVMDKPDKVLADNAPMFYRIASQIGMLAGDVPAMLAGTVAGAAGGAAAGGAIGTAVPVVGNAAGAAAGTLVGGGAGAMALPEAMRTVLMQHYEKGDVKSFADFWERTSAVAINTLKGGVIGGLTAGVGGKVLSATAKVAAPAFVKTSAQLTSEVLTMTAVGSALEGRVPEPHEIMDAAILVGGMRGVGVVAGKMRNMYGKGGVMPIDAVETAVGSGKLKQEMLADNVAVPGRGEFNMKGEVLKAPEKIETIKALKKEPNPDLSPEINTILGKVGEQAERPTKMITAAEVYTNLVDKLDPINQATKTLSKATELPAEKNPYVLARTSVDFKAKAKHMFENGVLDFKTLENKGGSLKQALESVESIETLEAYMISKRVVEKTKQGIQTGFDTAAAEAVVKNNAAKYEAAAKQVTDFSNGVLDYVRDAGILTKEQAARMKEANKDYVPFKRIIEDDGKVGSKKGGGKAGSLKNMKGSTRDIQSPITSIVENTIQLVQMAEVNRPKEALVKLAAQTPDQQLIKSVPDRMEPIKVNAAEIIKGLEDQGAITTIESIKKSLKEKGLKVDDDAVLAAFEKEQGITQTDAIRDITIFRKQKKDLSPNQFEVYEKGKRKVYETTPELAEAIARLGGDAGSTNLLFKMMNGITLVKKFGITFTPDFIARNLFRDILTASTFSKSKKPMSPFDIVGAMGDVWKKNDTYYEWLKSGGANGAFIEMGERYVKTDIIKLQKETNLMGAARNVIEKPIEIMRVAAELSEQSLRVAEFKKVRKAGGSLTEGGMASREITIDFQRVGAKMSALNSITAFMNVSVQGLDRTVRAFKENPTAVATKSMAYITVPSVLLWWANHDDPRYQEIPRWEKDLFWIIPTDNWTDSTPEEADGLPEYMVRQEGSTLQINKGAIYRLPKPQELGIIFGSLPERTLEAFFGDNPDSFKGFSETMVGLVTPSFIPDAVAPAMEQYFNKSFFTGRDIVPHHLKDVLPEYQFVEYTSETAKSLGKMVATVDKTSDFASPMVLQNYIRSWGGSLGQYALQISDKALTAAGVAPPNVDPTSTLSDVPFIKSFVVRFPSAGSNSVQDFYTTYEENKQVMNTVRHLAKEGDFDSMEKEFLLQSNQDNLIQLDGIKDALSTQSNLIRQINKNPEMSPDEKRQLIDGLYLQMTEVAKQGNQMMREIKKELGE